jgi:hypothetical protein
VEIDGATDLAFLAMKRLGAVVAVFAVMVTGTWSCGGGNGGSDARAKGLDRREQALDQREKQLDERERELNAPAQTTTATTTATTTTAPSPYPREIALDAIQDQRIRDQLQRSGAATAVELAPGVYAEKGQAPVGNADQYTTILGLCADVNAYEQVHGQRGHSCW